MTKKLLTEPEAADMLGLAPKTLSRWRWAGKGPRVHRPGGRAVRYAVADLEAFLLASTEACDGSR